MHDRFSSKLHNNTSRSSWKKTSVHTWSWEFGPAGTLGSKQEHQLAIHDGRLEGCYNRLPQSPCPPPAASKQVSWAWNMLESLILNSCHGGHEWASYLEKAGTHNNILVPTKGQQRYWGARAEGTELYNVDITFTRHRVRGAAARIFLHAVNLDKQGKNYAGPAA